MSKEEDVRFEADGSMLVAGETTLYRVRLANPGLPTH